MHFARYLLASTGFRPRICSYTAASNNASALRIHSHQSRDTRCDALQVPRGAARRRIHNGCVALSPHSTTSTPTPTRPTRLHPYVRHARFPRRDPREDVGVGVVECSLYALHWIAVPRGHVRHLTAPCSTVLFRISTCTAPQCNTPHIYGIKEPLYSASVVIGKLLVICLR